MKKPAFIIPRTDLENARRVRDTGRLAALYIRQHADALRTFARTGTGIDDAHTYQMITQVDFLRSIADAMDESSAFIGNAAARDANIPLGDEASEGGP